MNIVQPLFLFNFDFQFNENSKSFDLFKIIFCIAWGKLTAIVL